MGAAARNGLRHSVSLEQRKALIKKATDQRFVEFRGGEPQYIPGTVNQLDETTDPVQREFFDFYRTARGAYAPKGQAPEQPTKPMLSSIVKLPPHARRRGSVRACRASS
ncbi:hypothetical protein POL67_44080 [Polyangium sp. rjm3]|uniref:Uncharacterized protein n=1 Tax=Polyangium mundeleinium TaxID=2995306 RepID=A0ABT5F4G3_9BACT|nr:hypothetical protein [Polyangium mundeleinium]MDC0748387.1 hypothetical protein [Polyangium mundeleinium]